MLLGVVPNSPSGNQTYVASVYSNAARELATRLAGDGLDIQVVPTDTVLNPATDFVDLLHPNNGGHAKLATLFESYR